MPRDHIEYSQPVGDQVAYTTCYMCACRCGIKVHLRDGTLRYIEGNRNHPVNRGVLCAKGSAGIMNVLSPARLRAPLKRIGPRGSGEFAEISWDEALTIATDRLRRIRETDPNQLAFYTGRDQSQSLTAFFAQSVFAALWWILGPDAPATRTFGAVAAVLGLITVGCTAMIYASLKPIRQWHNPHTVPDYLIYAVFSGARAARRYLGIVVWRSARARDRGLDRSGRCRIREVRLLALHRDTEAARHFGLGNRACRLWYSAPA